MHTCIGNCVLLASNVSPDMNQCTVASDITMVSMVTVSVHKTVGLQQMQNTIYIICFILTHSSYKFSHWKKCVWVCVGWGGLYFSQSGADHRTWLVSSVILPSDCSGRYLSNLELQALSRPCPLHIPWMLQSVIVTQRVIMTQRKALSP